MDLMKKTKKELIECIHQLESDNQQLVNKHKNADARLVELQGKVDKAVEDFESSKDVLDEAITELAATKEELNESRSNLKEIYASFNAYKAKVNGLKLLCLILLVAFIISLVVNIIG